MVLQIQNDGPEVISTNYWQTAHSRRGYLYLSFNAGALRVLVPEAALGVLGQLPLAARQLRRR